MNVMRRYLRTAAAVLVAAGLAGPAWASVELLVPTAAFAGLPGASAQLARAPYLSDLTTESVQVTWATAPQSRGVVRYGTIGDCTRFMAISSANGRPITVNGVRIYESSLRLSGLATGTSYCYRVFTSDPGAVDLLGANPSPQFTTLAPVDSQVPVTFAVFGDWGDTTNGGVNDGSFNVNQAGVLAQVAASGAQFALVTGDTGYPGGTQTNYGDLNQTGADISAVFGPDYWALPGQRIPAFLATGNHGRNATFLNMWPQAATTAASHGAYAMVNFPSRNGTNAADYPSAYYAFSTGGVRIYVLDTVWSDNNLGDATGGACGFECLAYEADYEAHWTSQSAQYRWLAQDLAAHPEAIKMAVFHYPIRSDDRSEPSDQYLAHTPGSTNMLEQLLHDHGVRLVFSGHSHSYQRHIAPPDGVISYVTGGGGAVVAPVDELHCAGTDAYAIGWSYSKSKGYACGAATTPTTDAQVYHFLTVTVDGTTVTVTPRDSFGQIFDPQTYDFSVDTEAPSAPTGLTATVSSTNNRKVLLNWSPATDNVGMAGYDVYRNGQLLATTLPDITSYLDMSIAADVGYTYEVRARDLADNTSGATATVHGGNSDAMPPAAPGALLGSVSGATAADLTWTMGSDDVAVDGYAISRNDAPITRVPAGHMSYRDRELVPGQTYTYTVRTVDTAGNLSPASPAAVVLTPPDTTPPSAGSVTTTGMRSHGVDLAWSGASDDIGVARVELLRNGAHLADLFGTAYRDSSVEPGTAYTYTIRTVDLAGNVSVDSSVAVTTPPVGSLTYDGFENGSMAGWNAVNSLTVQSSLAHAGSYAARATSSGEATYAYEYLPFGYHELWAQAWVHVVSRSSAVNLLGFRTSTGASILNVYLDANGRVSLRNNAGFVTTYGTSVVAAGAWHKVSLHTNISTGSVEVFLDGTAVGGLSLTGQNLGLSPIMRLQLGETSLGRSYDVVFDDVEVSTASFGPEVSVPVQPAPAH